ncbi:Scr1 family TA system antitoxin-like transcriptional regulator [Saccharopolyspora sp. 6V]|uniref:Scr1 family TA system antitoxin-like transcriptional regulator n=1 Tax=Saccharopolyspora sp. 6V TaxID=2877239 RepID=UPI001CD3A752|nr:Scr1 family TA system antitoxin-like transcriptional regulator [Saccharopolyspora sp. 6V]MCA1195164.1 DUF5753 domain-containing protein [Saccharopolyspora sp. 6V]
MQHAFVERDGAVRGGVGLNVTGQVEDVPGWPGSEEEAGASAGRDRRVRAGRELIGHRGAQPRGLFLAQVWAFRATSWSFTQGCATGTVSMRAWSPRSPRRSPDNVEIQVVPLRADWHPGLEGLFSIASFSDGRDPVVHLENRISGLFLHETAEVSAYEEALGRMDDVAMSPAESSKFIVGIIEEPSTLVGVEYYVDRQRVLRDGVAHLRTRRTGTCRPRSAVKRDHIESDRRRRTSKLTALNENAPSAERTPSSRSVGPRTRG